MTERKGKWMLTYSGKQFYPYDLSVKDICIEDIAHGLPGEQRFGSQSPMRLTVAEHSLLVASLLPDEKRLWGLLHDASEAYIKDIPSPVKVKLDSYYVLEDQVMVCIAAKFGLPSDFQHDPEVKAADSKVLQWEQNYCWGDGHQPHPVKCYSPEDVKKLFMEKFYAYL